MGPVPLEAAPKFLKSFWDQGTGKGVTRAESLGWEANTAIDWCGSRQALGKQGQIPEWGVLELALHCALEGGSSVPQGLSSLRTSCWN